MNFQINIIVAVDKNMGIGRNGDQLAYISGDLKCLRALTTGHTIIMGRKTFEALPFVDEKSWLSYVYRTLTRH